MKKYSKMLMAQRIKEAREKRGLTQVEMSILVGRPYKTYQNWEIGKASPKRNIITKLANCLKVNPAYLEFGPPSRAKEITKEIIKTYFPKEQR